MQRCVAGAYGGAQRRKGLHFVLKKAVMEVGAARGLTGSPPYTKIAEGYG